MNSARTSPVDHPITTDRLIDFAVGTLDPIASRQISTHLAEGCPKCERKLESINSVLATTRTGLLREPPSWVLHRAKQLLMHHEVETASRGDRISAFLMDSRTVIGTIALAVFLIVMLSGAYVWRQIPVARTASLEISGTVEVQRKPAGEWMQTTNGAAVGAGMSLRTAQNAVAKLEFPNHGALELSENSLIRVSALHTLTNVGPQIVELNQTLGHGHYQIAPGRPGGGFTVNTPVVRVEGRDTEYDLTVEDDGTTTVQVHAGALLVSAGDQEVKISAGELLVISPTAPQNPLEPSPFPVTVTPTPKPSPDETATRPAVAPSRPTVTQTATRAPTATEVRRRWPLSASTATLTQTKTRTPTLTTSPTSTPTPRPSPTVPPTDTPQPPTSVPPSPTPVPPSPVPPSPTPVPPSPTPVPPTPVPPSPTPVPPPTDTPIPLPPTATPKPPPPLPTKPLPTMPPGGSNNTTLETTFNT